VAIDPAMFSQLSILAGRPAPYTTVARVSLSIGAQASTCHLASAAGSTPATSEIFSLAWKRHIPTVKAPAH
jgi:hypothetical protein